MSFRSGDLAEMIGVVLLQGTCAVAPIPRQEDFGLADALATLLRKDGPFLYTEDSFLVQFKSSSQKVIVYEGHVFDELRSQDVSVLVGHVNLKASTIDLYSLGPALAHPNFNDARGLVVHLKTTKKQQFFALQNDVLHVRLTVPILRWSVSEVADGAFMEKVYEVLKAHLTLERWNRQQRLTGASRQVRWETNQMPIAAGETLMVRAGREREALAQVVPAVRALAVRAAAHAELRSPVTALIRWLEGQAVEADPGGTLGTMLASKEAQDRMTRALSECPGADVALTFEVVGAGRDFLNFWVHSMDLNGTADGCRYDGSIARLREQGFEVDMVVDGTAGKVTVGVTDHWLAERRLVELPDRPVEGVFLFRRVEGA